MSSKLTPRVVAKNLLLAPHASEVTPNLQESFFDNDTLDTVNNTVMCYDFTQFERYFENLCLFEPERVHVDGPYNPSYLFRLQTIVLCFATRSTFTVQFEDTFVNCISCIRTSRVSYSSFIYLWLPKTSDSVEILKRFTKEIATYTPPLSCLAPNEIFHMFTLGEKNWNNYISKISVKNLQQLYFNSATSSNIDVLQNKLARFESPGEKERYQKHCKNYKFTCLITGPPQSGKTSLVKALALKHKRTLYTMFISSTFTRQEFQSMINTIRHPDKSVLLVSHIDTQFVNISPDALLDALKGLKNGLWLFMTCSKPQLLQTDYVSEFCSNTIIDFRLNLNSHKKQQVEKAFYSLVLSPENKFEDFWKAIANKELNFGEICTHLFAHFEDPLNAEALAVLTGQKSTEQQLYM
jgi:hypothetical protein